MRVVLYISSNSLSRSRRLYPWIGWKRADVMQTTCQNVGWDALPGNRAFISRKRERKQTNFLHLSRSSESERNQGLPTKKTTSKRLKHVYPSDPPHRIGSSIRGEVRTLDFHRADRHPWINLETNGEKLALEVNLQMGQAFRWKRLLPDLDNKYQLWAGVLGNHLVVLKQEVEYQSKNPGGVKYSDILEYKCAYEGKFIGFDAAVHQRLRYFFNLDIKLHELTEQFCRVDARYKSLAPQFAGIRLLQNDPVECLFSFICSSNNNIKRISQMVDYLGSEYGTYLGTLDGHHFFSFPSIEQLACKAEEDQLRNNTVAKFGYRAKFVVDCAKEIMKRGSEAWLESLKSRPREEVSDLLSECPGIGRKVASCIALLSLEKTDEIPVDVHVWRITQQYYLPDIDGKSLTDKLYFRIGDYYRNLFGPYCGWAHNLLFAADLRSFQSRIVDSVTIKEEQTEVVVKSEVQDEIASRLDMVTKVEVCERFETQEVLIPINQDMKPVPIQAKLQGRVRKKT
mmetsp:Transcript_161/g.271  ORF Transcript_161/g.271 Transcript_161/m.271 type:complete len:511 (-) Transcript_161:260-1792(-)